MLAGIGLGGHFLKSSQDWVESVAQPRKGRQSNGPRRQPWEKQVGEKALARATDIWGFIDDPTAPCGSTQNILPSTLSRQGELDCFEESVALPGLWHRGSLSHG
jgi:hypothetical protein